MVHSVILQAQIRFILQRLLLIKTEIFTIKVNSDKFTDAAGNGNSATSVFMEI